MENRARWIWLALVITTVAAACALEDDRGPGVIVGAGWQRARGVVGHRVHVVEHGVACRDCHDFSGGSVDVPTSDVCTTCHGEQVAHVHAAGAEAVDGTLPSACTTCHAFAGEDQGREAWGCEGCHERAQGEVPAVEIHARAACETCHRPHEDPQAIPSDCTDCHDDLPFTHHEVADADAQVCAGCHTHLHARAPQARSSCSGCHGEGEQAIPATATFAGGHDDCTTCHRPHAQGGAAALAGVAPARAATMQRVPCASCHENVPVLGEGRIAAHAECANCHAPHAPKSGITRACVSCHEGRNTDHPSVAGGAACSTCHSPHPAFGQQGPARECSHCHHEATHDTAFHGETACEGCHTPHQFGLSGAGTALCGRCHGSQTAAATATWGHDDCRGCHTGLPHRPAGGGDCARCHSTQTAALRPEHGACGQCHEPHGGSMVGDCSSCHASQHRTAPAGHRRCSSCHEPHAGTTKGGDCTSCHGDVVQQTHGRIAGGCEGCHAPHGPKPVVARRACASCHSALPGLHQVARHATCNDCHGGIHQAEVARPRAACLDCHRDMTDHNPDAPRCSSCHLFK